MRINVPIVADVFLTADGVEITMWSGDEAEGQDMVSWTALVNDLVDGYTVPNHRGTLTLNQEDFKYLKTVAGNLMDLADYLDETIEGAVII